MGRPKKPRNRLLDWLQYAALRLLAMMLHCFPVEAILQTANMLGDAMFAFDRKHRERALGNLRRSFPDMPEHIRRRTAQQSMRQLFLFFVELLFTTRLIRWDNWRNYIELADFHRTLDLLMDKRRGVILLTGHYGNWEILGYLLATIGFPTVSVARPLDNPYVNDYVLGVRERRGQKIIDKKGATSLIEPVLASGGAVGFIADQNAGSKGLFVDFFGRRASTYKSIGLLAMEHNVPVVIGYARRVENVFRFTLGTQDIIYPEDWRDQDDPLRYITQRYTKAIEDFVRTEPGQYLWVHRRWKSRPKGEVAEKFD
jgi:Kdo2-lipid IVA lauroyltransferase/acyltransferase